MRVGILKEIKEKENRVSMTPAGVEIMKHNGHELLVETTAGETSGFDDAAYQAAGAEIAPSPEAIFESCDMVMHVKEPLPQEYGLIRKDQIVFTYLHLAASRERRAQGDPFPQIVPYGPELEHCIHPEFLADQLTRSLERLAADPHRVEPLVGACVRGVLPGNG